MNSLIYSVLKFFAIRTLDICIVCLEWDLSGYDGVLHKQVQTT